MVGSGDSITTQDKRWGPTEGTHEPVPAEANTDTFAQQVQLGTFATLLIARPCRNRPTPDPTRGFFAPSISNIRKVRMQDQSSMPVVSSVVQSTIFMKPFRRTPSSGGGQAGGSTLFSGLKQEENCLQKVRVSPAKNRTYHENTARRVTREGPGGSQSKPLKAIHNQEQTMPGATLPTAAT